MSGAIACEADATMQCIDGGIRGAIVSTLAGYTPLWTGHVSIVNYAAEDGLSHN
jgi:hypothetical protein